MADELKRRPRRSRDPEIRAWIQHCCERWTDLMARLSAEAHLKAREEEEQCRQ